jgi:hypothetical protein
MGVVVREMTIGTRIAAGRDFRNRRPIMPPTTEEE